MPLGRNIRHDQLDVVHKSHIKHLVRFVEHDRFHFAEFQTAAVQEIKHSARRANDQMVFVPKIADLHVDVGAADANSRIETEAFGKYSEFLVDLKSQFARRSHNKDLFVFFVRYFVNQRKEKRSRFSGAGIGKAHDIPAIQNMKDDLVLDRSWLLVSAFFKSLKDRRIEFEIGKLVLGNKVLHFFSDDSGLVDERRNVERGQFES